MDITEPRAAREIIAARVRVEMARVDVTVTQLSERTGIARRVLWRRVHGITPISLDESIRIARALGVPPSAFIQDLADDRREVA